MNDHYRPGYHIFIGSAANFFEDAAKELQVKINGAMKAFDVKFIGGLSVKQDEISKMRCILMREAMLTPKKGTKVDG